MANSLPFLEQEETSVLVGLPLQMRNNVQKKKPQRDTNASLQLPQSRASTAYLRHFFVPLQKPADEKKKSHAMSKLRSFVFENVIPWRDICGRSSDNRLSNGFREKQHCFETATMVSNVTEIQRQADEPLDYFFFNLTEQNIRLLTARTGQQHHTRYTNVETDSPPPKNRMPLLINQS